MRTGGGGEAATRTVSRPAGYLTITPPGEVAMYADTFARLADLAVVGAEARPIITTAIDALK